jgi:hypothetical protein
VAAAAVAGEPAVDSAARALPVRPPAAASARVIAVADKICSGNRCTFIITSGRMLFWLLHEARVCAPPLSLRRRKIDLMHVKKPSRLRIMLDESKKICLKSAIPRCRCRLRSLSRAKSRSGFCRLPATRETRWRRQGPSTAVPRRASPVRWLFPTTCRRLRGGGQRCIIWSQAAPDALFGGPPAGERDDDASEAERACRQLDSLFGPDGQ